MQGTTCPVTVRAFVGIPAERDAEVVAAAVQVDAHDNRLPGGLMGVFHEMSAPSWLKAVISASSTMRRRSMINSETDIWSMNVRSARMPGISVSAAQAALNAYWISGVSGNS
jgi:hypothetical protein